MRYVKPGATFKEVTGLAGRVATIDGVHYLCKGVFNVAGSRIALQPLPAGEEPALNYNGKYEPVPAQLEALGWRRVEGA